MGQIKEVRDDNDKLEQENLDLKVLPAQNKIVIAAYLGRVQQAYGRAA